MKRKTNLFEKIISVENLQLADKKARRGKLKQYGVKIHDKNRDENILLLHQQLSEKKYNTSEYKTFTIKDPKVREISCLPYFPDRIVHHALMNYLEGLFVPVFTSDTYSCIKGKGIHAASRNLKSKLSNDVPGTKYCLKLDITKFYPSIDHSILKSLLRRKIKDADLLWLLDEIIDSAPGVPIGNYLSQYFANFYLAYFDHWIKESQQVQYYFRYADDIVILADNKEYLHQLLAEIREYLQSNLNLSIKPNYQVFPVASRGIDFVGYVHFHTHTLLRKRIKKSFAKKLKQNENRQSIPSYLGWAKHCNSTNLLKKLTHEKL